MKQIAIIGATGMLGSMVYGELLKYGYKLVLVLRNKDKLKSLYRTYGKSSKTKIVLWNLEKILDIRTMTELANKIGPVDGVVNCAGIIPQQGDTTQSAMFVLNSILPHMLSLQYGEKLIHVTTDCVYDGKNGAPFAESSPPTPDSLYGVTKYIGEPKETSLVMRTSLVGPELDGGSLSLLGWFLSQKKSVRGYTKHHWNGITTREFAHICHTIISNRKQFPKTGLFHVFSSDMTKYRMLTLFADKYHVKTKIVPYVTPKIDRRLTTNADFCRSLHVPTFEKMLEEL